MSYRFLPLLSTVYSWYGVHQIEFWENSCVLKRAKIVQTSYFYWPAVIKWKSLKNRTIVIHSRRNFNGKNILQYQVTFCEVTWFDNNSRLSKKGVNSNFFAAIKSTFYNINKISKAGPHYAIQILWIEYCKNWLLLLTTGFNAAKLCFIAQSVVVIWVCLQKFC